MNPQPTDRRSAGDERSDEPDRRDLRRIPFECNTLLRLEESLTFRARLRNISADAVQIICEPRYALLIHPGGTSVRPAADRLIDISVALFEYTDAEDFKATCRVKYCVDHDAERMALGLQFVKMDFRSVQHLDRFVETQRPQP
ncbi:MAG: c-di-GMP-binding flagellar brake protein YcgR [Gammaproteobacteria bacterium]